MESKVTQRREARAAGIVETAWNLAGEHGIAGVSLHALARELGIRQPSLYEYFDSKNALYDAMVRGRQPEAHPTARWPQAVSEAPRRPQAVPERVRGVRLGRSRPLRAAVPAPRPRVHTLASLVHSGSPKRSSPVSPNWPPP
jgi:AcrR family transcriptional regulator